MQESAGSCIFFLIDIALLFFRNYMNVPLWERN